MQKGNCLFKKKKKKVAKIKKTNNSPLEKITAIMRHEGTAFTAQHALKMLEAVWIYTTRLSWVNKFTITILLQYL